MPRTSAAMRGQNAPEHIQQMGAPITPDGSTIDEIDPNEIRAHDGEVGGSAVTAEDLAEPGPPVDRYLITKGGHVATQLNGTRARLVVGKTIDSLNYDIKLLRQQGIELKRIEEGEAPAGSSDID